MLLFLRNFMSSHLKELVFSFNGCVDELVDNLKQLADGKTQVPMKEKMKNIALEVISKVNRLENSILTFHLFMYEKVWA